MNTKRNRSVNWDEEEKHLLRSVLKDYSQIIEDKSLNTNTNKNKTKAWEAVHKKELNSRKRDLVQLKIQWKGMKVNARKSYSSYKKETIKTGGGARPDTPDDSVVEIKDLLNPAELLRDDNPFDSDGLVPTSSANEETLSSTSGLDVTISLLDLKPYEVKGQATDVVSLDLTSQECEQKFEEALIVTPLQTNMGKMNARKVFPTMHNADNYFSNWTPKRDIRVTSCLQCCT